MHPVSFFLIVGILFSVALYAAGYYVWSVPEQEAEDRLSGRLRELRAHTRSRSQKAPELLRGAAPRLLRLPGRPGDLGRRPAPPAGD